MMNEYSICCCCVRVCWCLGLLLCWNVGVGGLMCCFCYNEGCVFEWLLLVCCCVGVLVHVCVGGLDCDVDKCVFERVLSLRLYSGMKNRFVL